jgi:hypothetical protein
LASSYLTGLDPLEEQRLLLVELDGVRAHWPVDTGTIEAMLGVAGGSLDRDTCAPLPGDAEAQLRRLLEVARLSAMLMGAGAAEWILAAEAELGFARPIDTMQKPGGLAYVRDLLRDAWETAAPEAMVYGGRA